MTVTLHTIRIRIKLLLSILGDLWVRGCNADDLSSFKALYQVANDCSLGMNSRRGTSPAVHASRKTRQGTLSHVAPR